MRVAGRSSAVFLLAALLLVSCGGGGGGSPTVAGPQPDPLVASDQSFTVMNPTPAGGHYMLDPGTISAVTGGNPSSGYTFTLAGGSAFPMGTTVDSSTGILSVTGALSGSSGTFDMVISDGHDSDIATITITASSCNSGGAGNCLAQCWGQGGAGTALPDGTVGHPYGATLSVKIGSSGQGCSAAMPLAWQVDGSGGPLPPGLALDTVRGVIHGTPTMAGTFNFKILVFDNNGMQPIGTLPTESITVN
jgi:hypothetical protein